jgi:5-methylcytosine-specific restriction protein A
MLQGFLQDRGFVVESDERERQGQTIVAKSPSGERLTMRVRLCWRREADSRDSERVRTYSAAQLLAKIKNNDWIESLQAKVTREKSHGVTHLLFVQRGDKDIRYAALLPLSELVPIWIAQRDISKRLIQEGKLGRRKKNHAMNGSSPTLWLQDDRGGKEVADALWTHPSIRDLAKLPVVPSGSQQLAVDDTFDDMPGIDSSLIGSDGAPAVKTMRSNVKRDPRVRAAVLKRAGGECEREKCRAARPFPGFLDVHHILGAEKGDRVWNCIALCPNCHRDAHASPDREKINADLLAFAGRFGPAGPSPKTAH